MQTNRKFGESSRIASKAAPVRAAESADLEGAGMTRCLKLSEALSIAYRAFSIGPFV